MRFLVTNDDGINDPGIKALIEALQDIGEIDVIAPDRNRSGASSSLTLSRPLRVTEHQKGYYSVDGTPTDCVHLAATGLFRHKIDMVVSGMNDGANLGDDVFYSGTVSCAIEGCFMGIQSLAISLANKDYQNYATAIKVTREIIKKFINDPLPKDTILNVNIPDVSLDELKGMEVTRLGRRHCGQPMIQDQDPRGKPIYWIGLPGHEVEAGPGTDFHAIATNHVSITPLQLDLTNYKTFDHVAQWIKDIEITC